MGVLGVKGIPKQDPSPPLSLFNYFLYATGMFIQNGTAIADTRKYVLEYILREGIQLISKI